MRTISHLPPLSLLLFVAPMVGATTASAGDLPPWEPDATASRADVPDVTKWDLTPLYASPEEWKAALQRLQGEADGLAAYRGRLSDPAALKSCLEAYLRIHDEANHVQLYASLRLDSAQTDEELQGMAQQGLALLDQVMQQASFIRGEILALSDKDLAKAYKKQPALMEYRRYIDSLRRRRDTVLDDDGERVLGLFGDNLWAEIDLNEIPAPPEDAYVAMLTDIQWPTITDAEGNEVLLNLSSFAKYRRDPDREVRRQAVAAMFSTMGAYRHVFAATLGSQAEFDVTLAQARGYDTAREAYLDKDDLDVAVYDNLITTINANLTPLHRYVTLRKQVMGVDAVHLYDLYVPLVAPAEAVVPYDQAMQTLIAALAPLGDDYLAVLSEGLDPANGWIDVYPHADKESGAFSASAYGNHPYVKMNYYDSMGDMSTLAHEYGHALHSYLSMHNQPYQDHRYVPFLAEIASTANEALVSDYLLAHADDDRLRAAILASRAERIRTTIYRQTLFAEFELRLHQFVEQGTPITASLLDETYADLVQRYYGPDYAMDPDDAHEWAYIPHFYWKYYVFVYATGLASGLAVSDLVVQGEPQRDAYLQMLSAGCAEPPLDLLNAAGVDLTTPAPIEAAVKVLDETLTQLEALLPRLAADDQASESGQ